MFVAICQAARQKMTGTEANVQAFSAYVRVNHKDGCRDSPGAPPSAAGPAMIPHDRKSAARICCELSKARHGVSNPPISTP